MKITIPMEHIVPQYAEMRVHTHLLSDILITLTQMALKLKDSDHKMTLLDFDFDTIDKYVSDIRLDNINQFMDALKESQDDITTPQTDEN